MPACSRKIKLFISLLAIISITVLVYSPVAKNNFLNWDDNVYVSENPHIKNINAENIKLWFTNSYAGTYLPFTMASYAIDYQIGGLEPKVYIFTNLLFHLCNAILVFLLVLQLVNLTRTNMNFSRNGIKISILAASIVSILFAIHPCNVESVAWVAERKNVLFAFFFLLSVIAYIRYVDRNKSVYLVISLLLFLCSLLSKGTAAALSLCILSIDYIYSRKLLSAKVIVEKVPFFILSLIFGSIAFIAQGKGSAGIRNPFHEQLAYASYGFVNYLLKLIVPLKLSAYYPYPQGTALLHWLCLISTITIFMVLIRVRRHLSRLTLFAVLFYLANIVFLIQLTPIGKTIMADRYIYIASIGFFLLMTSIIIHISKKSPLIFIFLAAAIVYYSVTAYNRVEIWNNNYSVWNDVIKNYNNVPIAWNNRGTAREVAGDIQGAYNDFNMAINITPDDKLFYNNRGIANSLLGKRQEAYADYCKAIALDPFYVEAYYNRGKMQKNAHNYKDALTDFNQAINLDPNYQPAYILRAMVKYALDDKQGAIADCDAVLKMNKKW